MSHIYIVVARPGVGEYSDHGSRICAAYRDMGSAEEHVRRAEAFAKEWFALDYELRLAKQGSFVPYPSPYDPEGLSAWRGTPNYRISSIELRNEVP